MAQRREERPELADAVGPAVDLALDVTPAFRQDEDDRTRPVPARPSIGLVAIDLEDPRRERVVVIDPRREGDPGPVEIVLPRALRLVVDIVPDDVAGRLEDDVQPRRHEDRLPLFQERVGRVDEDQPCHVAVRLGHDRAGADGARQVQPAAVPFDGDRWPVRRTRQEVVAHARWPNPPVPVRHGRHRPSCRRTRGPVRLRAPASAPAGRSGPAGPRLPGCP